MDENKKFEKGQFLTNSNKPGSFVIFEGIERDSTTVTKRYSVIANYEPSKYRELPNGTWGSTPFMEVATNTTRCQQTVEGDETSYWWRPCTEREKETAISVLHNYGYYWNEELKALINEETGEIVRTIITPKLEYHGELIRPITQEYKDLLRKICFDANKAKYSYENTNYRYSGGYGCYGGWDEDWYD